MRRWYGADSYICNFIREVIERDSFPSKCKRKICNLFTFESDLLNLRLAIAFHLITATLSLSLFYNDHIKDLFILRILGHVDETILKDDDDTKAYFSVGGCQFEAMRVYLILIFVFSEIVLYAYMSKQQGLFKSAFRIEKENRFFCWLVVLFPLHFTILTICYVNIKLALATYELSKILRSGNEENETDTTIAVIQICEEMGELRKQAYFLNEIKWR